MKKLILCAAAIALLASGAPASAAAWYGDGVGLECSLVPFSSGGGDVWMIMWRGRNERLTIKEAINCEPDARHVFFGDGGAATIAVPKRGEELFFLSGYYVTRGTVVRKFVVAFDPSDGTAEFASKERPEKKASTERTAPSSEYSSDK